MSKDSYDTENGEYDVPSEIQVPPGNALLLRAYGTGVQIYTCENGTPSKTARPHAILLRGDRDEGDLVAIHFGGPTWEATDGSQVIGDKDTIRSVPSPDPDGVPWLLLKAKAHVGDGKFSKVTYIQRLGTDGGKAPQDACDAEQAEVMIEYSADYLFYTDASE